jgi:hypothetical protein
MLMILVLRGIGWEEWVGGRLREDEKVKITVS